MNAEHSGPFNVMNSTEEYAFGGENESGRQRNGDSRPDSHGHLVGDFLFLAIRFGAGNNVRGRGLHLRIHGDLALKRELQHFIRR